MSSKNKIEKWLESNASYLIIIVLGLTIIAPYTFTQWTFSIDLTDTGEIGDTIAGTTAPIIGLLGAVLVYLALRAQIDANNEIKTQIKNQSIKENKQKSFEKLQNKLNLVTTIINDFKFEKKETVPNESILKSDSFNELFLHYSGFDHKCNYKEEKLESPKLIELLSIFNLINGLIDEIVNYDEKNLDTIDKEYFLSTLKFYLPLKITNSMELYSTKIIETNNIICEKCSKQHTGIPTILFVKAREIANKLEIKLNF